MCTLVNQVRLSGSCKMEVCNLAIINIYNTRKKFLYLLRLCSTYVSTVFYLYFDHAQPMFLLCSTFVSTVLDLFFGCSRPMFRLCSTCVPPFSAEIGYVLIVLDTCSDHGRPMFRNSRPKMGIFRLCSLMFRLSRPKLGILRLCARLKIASRPWNFSRKAALARLSKWKINPGKTEMFSPGIISIEE